jgi:hypothetical protein
VSGRLRILFSGMVAGDPGQGGATWAVLQYVLGLRRLGHDVWLVEPVGELTDERVAYFRDVVREFGIEERAALLAAGSRETAGVSYPKLTRAARSADLLVNVSAMLADERLVSGIATRVWLDLDPGFNQLWHAVEQIEMGFGSHNRFVTVGQRVGQPDCDVPACGVSWTSTLPPVVLEQWPPGNGIVHDGLTTVGNWRSYGSIEHAGRRYGQKAHAVRRLIALPTLTDERVMPAFAIHAGEGDDLDALHAHGWRLLDPASVASTPARYRNFVRASKAELAIAKEGYVVSRCGWFGDRSACYLAAGRPVVAADTQLGDALPVGEGLLTFTDVESAVAAIEDVRGSYGHHARAARAIAEEYLDSDRVLSHLLESL